MISVLLMLTPAVQVATPPEVQAKDLPRVTGPAFLEYGDPAGGHERDLGLRRQARKAPPLTRLLEARDQVVLDTLMDPSGRLAYQVTVPAGQQAHVRLRGDHEAWFVVTAVNRMGQQDVTLLRNRIPTGNPEAVCRNTTGKPVTVFFIVDTTETQVLNEPFRLTFTFQPVS